LLGSLVKYVKRKNHLRKWLKKDDFEIERLKESINVDKLKKNVYRIKIAGSVYETYANSQIYNKMSVVG
jgi:hypothetical protein